MPAEMEAPYGGTPAEWAAWANALVGCRATGLTARSVSGGRAEFVMERCRLALNPNGAVHGGLVAFAVDQVMGVVVTSSLPAGQVAVTATLTMEYHLPAVLPLLFRGQVARIGRGMAFVEVDVENGRGRVCSRGRGSMVPRLAEPGLAALGETAARGELGLDGQSA